MLKKSNMDPDIASSYRPISNLPYISKLVERVVTRRFTAHCSAFNLLPTHQSAYRPFHSTETALLSVHNDLARSIDNGHVSLLVLLDLSAALDTVDSRGQPDAQLLGRLQRSPLVQFSAHSALLLIHRGCRRPDGQTQRTISLVR